MGILIYGGTDKIEFDDRTLAHLKIVLTAKLRRSESFSLSWVHAPEDGSGRSTIWMHPAIPLRFQFQGNRQAELNRDWLERLMVSANSTGGLQIVPEEVPDSAMPS